MESIEKEQNRKVKMLVCRLIDIGRLFFYHKYRQKESCQKNKEPVISNRVFCRQGLGLWGSHRIFVQE